MTMLDTDLAITPGGRVGDASPLGKSGKRRLDDYVRMVAHALMRKRGFTKGHAIATAKNALKRWSRGGGHVRPQVRAGAAAHLGVQKALDAGLSHEEAEEFIDFAQSLGLDDTEIDLAFRYRHGWIPLGGMGGGPAGGTWSTEDKRARAKQILANSAHGRVHRMELPAATPQARKPLVHVNADYPDPTPGRSPKSRKAVREQKRIVGRHKKVLDAAMREQRRRLANTRKINLAQQEQARRIIASTGLRTGPRQPLRTGALYTQPDVTKKRIVTQGFALSSFSAPQLDVLDFAVGEAQRRGLELDFGIWSEALHPRDPFGRFRGKGEHDVKETAALEKRYRSHVKRTDARLIKLNTTHSTHLTHAHTRKTDDGVEFDWSKDPERQKMHAKLVNNVYRRQAATAKSERKALFLGGLPGAGKSTALKKLPGIDEKDYITVNPDIFKEELAKHGLVPNISGMSPMEASGLVHEESSHLAGLLAEKARKNGKNIAYDITMNSPGSVHKRMNPLDESGYESKAVFVDIPHDMSQKRVEQRHRNGWLRYIKDTSGTNLGQRLVPSSHVGAGRSKKGSSSANFDAFQEVKHRFKAYRVYDNSGESPRLADSLGSF